MTKVSLLLDKAKVGFKDFSGKSLFQKCDIISFCLLFLFFVDCSFSGGGKLVEVGPLSFRMLIGGLALLFALPKFVLNIKKYLKNPIFYLFLAFIVFLGFSAVRGLRAANNMSVLISDIKGFMWLFTVPALVITVDNKKRFNGILNAIIFGAWIQVAFVVLVHFSSCFSTAAEGFFYETMLGEQLGILDKISDKVFRIFMRSSPYLIIACVVLIFRQLRCEKLKWRYIVSVSVFLFCILITFTRSIYGCVFVVVAFVVLSVCVFYRDRIKMMLKSFACIAIAAILIVTVLEFAFDASYINFAVSRTLGTPVKTSVVVIAKYKVKHFVQNIFTKDDDGSAGDDLDNDKLDDLQDYINITGESDGIRAITKSELKELIVKNPIIGNGLGACSKTRNGPDEYFYYDMLARMGIIGLGLYLAPFIFICAFILKRRRLIKDNPECIALLCAMIGFWMVTWFNPWMNAVLGIAVYALCCSAVEVFGQNNTQEA